MAADSQPIQTTGTVLQTGSPISKLPIFQNMGTLFGLAAALSLGVGIILWAIQPDYVPIYGSLSERDKSKVIEALRAENIPFRIEQTSGLVTIPNDQIQNARMKLSTVGISQDSMSGYELLSEDQSLGTSQFIENARYQHILETELGRTISKMKNIDTARVHLALPKQTVFVRKRSKTSASVFVKLLPGRSLEQGQVSSIVHLVASSIPYLETSQVTIVDQWGRLLTTKGSSDEMGQTSRQFEYTRKLEETYAHRIESLLTPILGLGKVKAEVNAELDFSSNESTQEQYDPDVNTIRSEQINESQSVGSNSPFGVPGTLSNQPPGAGTTQDLGQGTTEGTDESIQQPLNSNKNTTRNYELGKTITRTRLAQGIIKRITVALVVDERMTKDDKGQDVRLPLEQTEIDLITQLVKEAIGFKEERGDSISIMNSKFQEQEKIEAPPEEPIWKKPWIWTILKQVLAGLVVLFVIFGIVRPGIKKLSEKPVVAKADKAIEDDNLLVQKSPADALPAPPHVYGDILNLARAMAADDPKRVAKVVKDWLNNDA